MEATVAAKQPPENDLIAETAAVAGASWRLSPRQNEVLALVLRGLCNKEVAAQLDCAEGTVEFHLSGIFRRAGVTSRGLLFAAAWCLQGGRR
jgi:DNA-binding CsgD family transcriptional regulator